MFSTRILHPKHNGLERLSLDSSADSAQDISRVLHSVAHWNWHFKRQGSDRFRSDLALEFYRLEQGYDHFDGQHRLIWKAAEPIQNVIIDGVMELTVNPKHRFGAKIINNTDHNLYPYLFYFGVKYQNVCE